VPGLAERLRSGVAVAELGCGTGHAVNLLAEAFSSSDFVGYDVGTDAIDAARAEARAMGLDNVRFEVRDVAMLPANTRFDVVLAFDAIHDQARPRQVLAETRRVLHDDGIFVMVDMNLSSHLEENIGNPVAPYLYTVSLFHCMQVSLAEGGEGLGAAWGREQAHELLTGAGFGSVEIVPSPPEDMVNVIFVARP
jgi:ubiquinone/menaquinone biosynthesis C-methylase UbiE